MRTLLTIISTSLSFFSTALAEDKVRLKNGDTLTGKITNSDQAGVFNLNYPETADPLKIKEDFIDRIDFLNTPVGNKQSSEKILLSNGDFFPCKLKSMDADTITFDSNYMGTHSIPRNKVRRVQFNNKAQNVIFKGPEDDLSVWKTSSNDWKLKDGILTTKARTQISTTINNLPQNFVIDFNLSWTDDAPRIKFYFCAESTDLRKKLDCYLLDMSSMELRVSRYLKRLPKTLNSQNADEKTYTQKNGKVSLYVDRKNKKVILYFNNKKIKECKDIATPPKGSGILFHTHQRTGQSMSFSQIKVSTWNNNNLPSSDDENDRLKKNDIITDTNGNLMTGKLLGFTKKGSSLVADFNIPFSQKPSSIPFSKILYIDLQQAGEKKVDLPSTGKLTLNSGGTLSYHQSQLIDDKFVFKHPLLGELKIKKSIVSQIQTNQPK